VFFRGSADAAAVCKASRTPEIASSPANRRIVPFSRPATKARQSCSSEA
jgi:hypothetical protein